MMIEINKGGKFKRGLPKNDINFYNDSIRNQAVNLSIKYDLVIDINFSKPSLIFTIGGAGTYEFAKLQNENIKQFSNRIDKEIKNLKKIFKNG